VPGRRDVRDRLDAVRGADPGRDPIAGGHRGDRAARRGAAVRVLGRARRAVPALRGGPRRLPEVLPALPAVHPPGPARRRLAPHRGRRAGGLQLVRGAQLLGDLADPGVVAQAALNARVRVHVRVPATSANLGPGFDALGLALDLYNEVTATEADTVTLTLE